MNEPTNKVDIFWTGGMDSTFRLIQLLTTTKNVVQPHYIIRFEHCTGIEIDTMITLRRMIVRKFPDVRSRFLPTIFINEGLIPEFKDLADHIEELRKLRIVTDQYQLMANYCRAFSIEHIDVAFIKNAHSQEKLNLYKQCQAFNSFSYPIVDVTKKDIFRIAKTNDFFNILIKTTFCHRPKKKISPCGICGPCNDAVMAGMGFRLPLIPYIKARITIPLRKYWRKNYFFNACLEYFSKIRLKGFGDIIDIYLLLVI